MAMAEDSDLEKSEEPTGRRIEQAREQGQVPHSQNLALFLFWSLLVQLFGQWVDGLLVAQWRLSNEAFPSSPK